MEHYRDGHWQKAIQAFNKTLQLNANDHLSGMYIKRCEKLQAKPPKDWQGVWVMDDK